VEAPDGCPCGNSDNERASCIAMRAVVRIASGTQCKSRQASFIGNIISLG
jgi:hypothetical protein